MSKPTTKRMNFNKDILNKLKSKYGYSIDYIRKCLRKDREGIMPDKLIKEYKRLENASKIAIENAAKQN